MANQTPNPEQNQGQGSQDRQTPKVDLDEKQSYQDQQTPDSGQNQGQGSQDRKTPKPS